MASGMGTLRALIREVAKGLRDTGELMDAALEVVEHDGGRMYILYDAGYIEYLMDAWEKEGREEIEKELKSLEAQYRQNKSWGPFPYDTPAKRKQKIEKELPDLIDHWIRKEIDEKERELVNSGDHPITAMMKVVPREYSTLKEPQWGAATVVLSAAQPGWGPFMYDLVMSAEGGLVPDRRSVSPAAAGVWRKYKDARSDVEAKPLDDPKHPRTKTKQDDSSRLHDDPAPKGKVPQNPLNYAYFLKGSGPNVSALKSRHQATVPTLNKYGINLRSLAWGFFQVKYNQ